MFKTENLTPAQLDGLACVRCGKSFMDTVIASVPVGAVDRGQVFACSPECKNTSGENSPIPEGIGP